MYENLQTRVLLFWEIYQLKNMNEGSPLMAGLHHRIILFFEPARSYFSVEILFARIKPYSLTCSWSTNTKRRCSQSSRVVFPLLQIRASLLVIAYLYKKPISGLFKLIFSFSTYHPCALFFSNKCISRMRVLFSSVIKLFFSK